MEIAVEIEITTTHVSAKKKVKRAKPSSDTAFQRNKEYLKPLLTVDQFLTL